jgi:hypothetical protein
VFDNPEDMFTKEAEIVTEEFLSENNTYNLKKGGFGGFDYVNSMGLNNVNHTNEQRKLAGYIGGKKSSALHGIKNFKGKRNLKSFLGKSHTEETKRKIAEVAKRTQSGSGNSQYGTIWITDGKSNRKMKHNLNIPAGWSRGRTLN